MIMGCPSSCGTPPPHLLNTSIKADVLIAERRINDYLRTPGEACEMASPFGALDSI